MLLLLLELRSPAPQTAELLSLISRSRTQNVESTTWLFAPDMPNICTWTRLLRMTNVFNVWLSGGTTELLSCQFTLTWILGWMLLTCAELWPAGSAGTCPWGAGHCHQGWSIEPQIIGGSSSSCDHYLGEAVKPHLNLRIKVCVCPEFSFKPSLLALTWKRRWKSPRVKRAPATS